MKEMKLLETILDEMSNVSKPQKKFFTILMKTMVSVYGKVNFQKLEQIQRVSEKTFRRWFRIPFDFSEFNSKAIDKVVATGSDVGSAFDQSFEGKSGKKTWGKDYFWNGCASRAEKGLELVFVRSLMLRKTWLIHWQQSKHRQSRKQSTRKHQKMLQTTLVWIFT